MSNRKCKIEGCDKPRFGKGYCSMHYDRQRRDAMKHSPDQWKLFKAHARLIAAAPALLEACEEAKKYLEPDLVEPGRTVFWKLVAALKAAKGGRPWEGKSRRGY